VTSELQPIQPTITLEQRAARIRALVGDARKAIIEIGKELLLAKAQMEHGQWLPWLKKNFGWSNSTAQNYMNVARAFGKFPTVGNLVGVSIEGKALYYLSGKGVTEDAREKAIVQVKQGKKVTLADAKRLNSKAKRSPARERVMWERIEANAERLNAPAKSVDELEEEPFTPVPDEQLLTGEWPAVGWQTLTPEQVLQYWRKRLHNVVGGLARGEPVLHAQCPFCAAQGSTFEVKLTSQSWGCHGHDCDAGFDAEDTDWLDAEENVGLHLFELKYREPNQDILPPSFRDWYHSALVDVYLGAGAAPPPEPVPGVLDDCFEQTWTQSHYIQVTASDPVEALRTLLNYYTLELLEAALHAIKLQSATPEDEAK
jgi:Protein of unknown function (DUF3102)